MIEKAIPLGPGAQGATTILQAFPWWGLVAVIVLLVLICAGILIVRQLRSSGRGAGANMRRTPRTYGDEGSGPAASEEDARRRDVRAPTCPRRRIGVSRYTACGGRDLNEDACGHRFDEGSLVAVVCDGLGGHGGGDVASRTALDHIVEGWDPTCDEQGLVGLLEEASAEVHELAETGPDMRTTAVVLTLARGRALWANAGDSRLYHFVGSNLVWQTRDNSVSQMAVMMGEITPDQIRFHGDRARLTKALGQEGPLKPDVGELALDPQEENAFLLCTDGFWEYVLEEEMEQTLADSSSPSDWLRRMRMIHAERCPEDCDNNTAIACWLTTRGGNE